MSDYQDKVHKDGPNKLVIESGGTLEVASGASVTRTVNRLFNAGMRSGAGAGWTVAGNTSNALMAASQTAGTLIVPISGLKVGDTINSFKVIAQIESAGNAVTLDADLRKQTNAAADPTDASLESITQVSVVADTAVADEKVLSTPEVVAEGENYYVLVTGTTLGSTDVQFQGIVVNITEA